MQNPESSSLSQDSWPKILAALTDRARIDGSIAEVKSARGLEEKIRVTQDLVGVRRKITSWISYCSESRYPKSGGTASKLRDEGNAKFAQRDIAGSLRLYSESVICAPRVGPELSLAFGNRSAALYHRGSFRECLSDVALALKHKFPKDSEYKLYQRRGLCLMRLGRPGEALEALQTSLDVLNLAKRLPTKRRDSIAKDIKALITEINSVKEGENGKGKLPEKDDAQTDFEFFKGEDNPSLPGASACLEMRESPSHGRHIVALKELSAGQLLFSETPYCSVLLPEHYSTHCHHCHVALVVVTAVPCLECTQPRYCSDHCRSESWNLYHRFECGGLDLLHSVGVAHLAARTVLVQGLSSLMSLRPLVDRKTFELPKSCEKDLYSRVFNLVEHSKRTSGEDLFQYATTANLLTTYLEQRTSFFEDGVKDDGLSTFISAAIFKHILQLVCNASAIFEVAPTFDADDQQAANSRVYSETQQRIATAIYPSASMMNHSCDPDVISSFVRNRLIVRAIRDLAAGREVFNCYGPHFRRHRRAERQEALLSQYHFSCTCSGCSDRKMDDFVDRFFALRCRRCGGPIRTPAEHGEEDIHELPCMDCGLSQSYTQQIADSFAANELFLQGQHYLSCQDLNPAIESFRECLSLRRRALYEYNEDLVTTRDRLAECYAMAGKYKESALCLKECLVAVEKRYGSSSIEYAHELVKQSDVLSAQLQEGNGGGTSSVMSDLKKSLEKASVIVFSHYGQDNPTYVDIKEKMKNLLL